MVLTIFVIDDEESIRDTFKWHLEDLGHEVKTFAEPMHCNVHLEGSCQKNLPCCDALLIDYHMPGMNGLEFIEKLANGGCKGNTSNVLLMSGDTTIIDMQRVEKVGCRMAQKPISLEFIDEWIAEVKTRIRAV